MPSILHRAHNNEGGQSLPLFALFVFIFLGFCAMSIDVGRYVWARTSMQAGVDAAAVAAAQDMPNQTQAEATAAQYWTDNSGFIQSQGTNVSFNVSYPPGNKRIRVSGAADIPTWFAKFFGVPKWQVSASGDAEAQVLDIVVVLDVSGSMCYDLPILHTESSEATLTGPGHFTPANTRPTVADWDWTGTTDNTANSLNNTKNSPITIKLNTNADMAQFATNERIVMHASAAGVGSYEIFKVTAKNNSNKTLTLDRAQPNNFGGPGGTKIAHAVNVEIWQTWGNCADAVRSTSAPYQAEPFDGTIAAAEYFTTLFNPSYDKIGAAKYSSNSASITSLSSTHSSVKNAIHNLVPPSGTTNIAGGISAGRHVLDGTGKRANAVRVLVILTDGIANYICGTNDGYATSDYNALPCDDVRNVGEGTTANNHAYSEAVRATNSDIMIFAIGLGSGVQPSFLKRIADGGTSGVGPCQQNQPGCRYYFAPTPDQLDEAFEAIAEQTHIALVK